MKLSAAKVTAPAPKQVFRRPGCMDVIGLHDEEPPTGATPLLRTVMRGGRRTGPPDSLAAARARFEADLAGLPAAARRIQDPEAPVPAASAQLEALTAEVRGHLERALATRPGTGAPGR